MKNKLKIVSILFAFFIIVVNQVNFCYADSTPTVPESYQECFNYAVEYLNNNNLGSYVDFLIMNETSQEKIGFYFFYNGYKCNSSSVEQNGMINSSYTLIIEFKNKDISTMSTAINKYDDSFVYCYGYLANVVYSTFDIKDSAGNVVFRQAPVVGTLAPIVQETPLEGTVQEIVEVLPIVLIILVGLISLRKALALLSQILHQA